MPSCRINVLLCFGRRYCLGGSALPALAQESAPLFINSADVKWGEAPPFLPKGAKIAVLNGDPGKPAPYTLRLIDARRIQDSPALAHAG